MVCLSSAVAWPRAKRARRAGAGWSCPRGFGSADLSAIGGEPYVAPNRGREIQERLPEIAPLPIALDAGRRKTFLLCHAVVPAGTPF